jgi:hypothetical protein
VQMSSIHAVEQTAPEEHDDEAHGLRQKHPPRRQRRHHAEGHAQQTEHADQEPDENSPSHPAYCRWPHPGYTGVEQGQRCRCCNRQGGECCTHVAVRQCRCSYVQGGQCGEDRVEPERRSETIGERDPIGVERTQKTADTVRRLMTFHTGKNNTFPEGKCYVRLCYRNLQPGRVMNKHPAITRSLVLAGTLVAAIGTGSTQAGAQELFYSPQQRIFTLAATPQCLGGTVDVNVQSGYAPNEIRANFTTHLYSPAWAGSSDYECYLTIYADWYNRDTGIHGTTEHRVASWRFQGPNVADPYMDIDTGAGTVTITFRTSAPHAPSPTFEVPAR